MSTEHKVKQGECLSSIAAKYGLFPDTVWDDPANADLKQRRGDPNVLAPGDVVVIPDKRAKEESGSTEKRHRFRKKGVPAKLKIQVMLDGKARANEAYVLSIDGVSSTGTTDGDGFVEADLPPDAREGELSIGPPEERDVIPLQFGAVDPVDTQEGVAHRLHDLGLPVAGDLDAAVREFQREHGLEPTGEVDDATRSKLVEVFGQ